MVSPARVPSRNPVGAYLTDLMALVVRASPGPLTVTRRPSGSYQVRSSSPRRRPLATFARRPDAELFVRAVSAVRALAVASAELLDGHRDDGTGRCARCREQAPCWTRRTLDSELVPRADG